MAKQPKAKKTPCEDGGDELLPWSISVATTSAIDVVIRVCFANARVRIWLQPDPFGDAVLLADETGKSEVPVRLPTLTTGRYQLFWSVQTPAEKWQTRSDILVDTVTRFRRRKSSDGNNPVNMGTVALTVHA
jgi:hypothetical protein